MNVSKKATISQEQIQQTAVSLGLPDHPFIGRRIVRAFDIVESDKVTEISKADEIYLVGSQYDANKSYVVNLNHGAPSCDCLDNRTIFCKHHIASLLYAKQEQKASKLILYINPINNARNQWAVDEGDDFYIVRRHQNEKWTCTCGKPDCKHCKAIRENLPKPKIENKCGSNEALELQSKLNGQLNKSGNNGTGDNSSPVSKLDANDPFQEAELLDIDQIEGRSNGDLVHKLKNGEYVINYRGIMSLAEQHKITFEASRHDETHTIIAHARCENNTRISGKPVNGSEMTAMELAKRNAARQLLPYPEVKALEYKAKQAIFDWERAKAACFELVPNFKLDIIIDDLVRDGTLRQAHPSDYNRKEWLLIFDACKHDAETNGDDDNDDDNNGDGDNTPSSNDREVRSCQVVLRTSAREHRQEFGCLENAIEFKDRLAPTFKEGAYIVDSKTGEVIGDSNDEQTTAVCCICGRTLTNKLSISRCVGPECYKKVGAQGAQFLQDDEVSDELIEASQLYQDEVLQKRILRACLTLDAPVPVKVLRWLGNEFFGYKNRPILYYVCADGQLNRIDTHRRRLRHVIITSAMVETELDAHALAQMVVDVAEVEDTTADDDTPTNGDGKRKLQMDKNLKTWLVEADGTKTELSCREICEQFSRPRAANFVMQLRSGIDSGGDISTVELD